MSSLVSRICIIIFSLFAFATVLSASDAKPDFSHDVAPIIFQNCAGCHHPGEVAPFSLTNFQETAKHAEQIARVTGKHYMPPWKPKGANGVFEDERGITEKQVQVLRDWAEAGAPEGDPAACPPAPKFASGWHLGEPDLVLQVPEAFTVPAEGRDVFRCFVLPLNFKEDKYVSAIEFRPGNRKVVHHALLFLDKSGKARQLDEKDPGPGYTVTGGVGFLPTGGLGGWAPGALPHPLPNGMARLVQAGSDLVLQIHYHPSGKAEQDQPSVAIYLAKKTPEKLVTGLFLGNRNIDIAPGVKNYKLDDDFTLPVDVELVGITPHAHYICKDMKGSAKLPDGTVKQLISIDDWDFSWQEQYLYKTPLKLPKGTAMHMEYVYDNSADNARNPNNPPKRITFGEQTSNEMALMFMQVVTQSPADTAELRKELLAHRLRTAFGGGKNGGGLLDRLNRALDGKDDEKK